MADFPLTIPTLGNKLVDLRHIITGDSFHWNWERPLSQVQYLAIHHTAAPDTQTPEDIALYHVQNRGWGGIGYHLMIDKTGVVSYVGDITTARANVQNKNELVIGICLIGNFTGGAKPTTAQITSTHYLCRHFIFATPELTSVTTWDSVVGHQQLGSTLCPGDAWLSWRTAILTAPVSPVDPRRVAIVTAFQKTLGRAPTAAEIAAQLKLTTPIELLYRSLVESVEHQKLIKR